VTVVGSAFFGSGIGTTLNFVDANTGPDANTTIGGYGQAMFVMNTRTSLGVSYGLNQLQGANSGPKLTNSALVAGLYNKYGKMLRSTLEATYSMTSDDTAGNTNNTGIGLSGGMLLLF